MARIEKLPELWRDTLTGALMRRVRKGFEPLAVSDVVPSDPVEPLPGVLRYTKSAISLVRTADGSISYNDAWSVFTVLVGLKDDTTQWSFAVLADPGITAAFGLGADRTRLAVTAASVSGYVYVAATRAGHTTLSLVLPVVIDGAAPLDADVAAAAQAAAAAAAAAGAAQTTADSRPMVWVQTSAPTIGSRPNAINGDSWLDSDDGNRAYLAVGGSWVKTQAVVPSGTSTPAAPTVSFSATKRSLNAKITPQAALIFADGWDVQISRDNSTWYCPNLGATLDSDGWYAGVVNDALKIDAPSFSVPFLPIPLDANSLPLAAGQAYYLRVRARCSSPVATSAWTTSAALTVKPLLGADIAAAQVAAAQIAVGALDMTKFASGIRPPRVVAALPVNPYSGYALGDTVVNTGDGKLYRMTNMSGAGTTGWSAAVAAGDMTGQLTDAQIAAIAAAKLTGQITTTQITDDAVTTAKVAAGAITASEIAAGAVTTAAMTANTINGDRITAGTIAADKIAANSITAGQIATGAIGADEIAAGAITTNKLSVGRNPNLLKNSDFSAGTWNINWQQAAWVGTLLSWGANLNADWALPAEAVSRTAYVSASGTNACVIGYYSIGKMVVIAGQRYEASGYFGLHRCAAKIEIEWYSNSGYLSSSNITLSTSASGGPTLAGYARLGGFVVAPAGATLARFDIKLDTVLASNPYMFLTRLMFAEAGANQTELSPWTPGGVTVITPGEIAVDNLAAINANLGTITAGKLRSYDWVEGVSGFEVDLDAGTITNEKGTFSLNSDGSVNVATSEGNVMLSLEDQSLVFRLKATLGELARLQYDELSGLIRVSKPDPSFPTSGLAVPVKFSGAWSLGTWSSGTTAPGFSATYHDMCSLGDGRILYYKSIAGSGTYEMVRSAAGSWPASDTPINSDYYVSYPSLVLLGDKRVLCVYANAGDNCYYSTIRGTDGVWSTPVKIDNAVNQYYYGSACLMPDGSVLEVLHTDNSYLEAFVRSPSGVWSGPTTITSSGRSPAVMSFADGTAICLFYRSPNLMCITRGTDGTWSNETTIVAAGSTSSASAAMLPDGSLMCTLEGSSTSYILRTGGVWGALVSIATGAGRTHLTVQPNGTLFVAKGKDCLLNNATYSSIPVGTFFTKVGMGIVERGTDANGEYWKLGDGTIFRPSASNPSFSSLSVSGNATVNGNIIVGGLVDGINISEALDQAVKSTSAPTFAGLTLNGALLPASSATGSQSIAKSGSWTVPRGVYMFGITQSFFNIQVRVGSTWYSSGDKGGVVISDGSNLRIINIDTENAYTTYYRKF